MKKNYPRSSGILMHLSSLPGPYGHGTMGQEAFDFIDFLSETGCSYWQILPIGPTDSCHSPYKSCSTFAGNPHLIDLTLLAKDHLLTPQELESFKLDTPWRIEHTAVEKNFNVAFKLAFSRLTENMIEHIHQFAKMQAHWLPDYVLYQVIQHNTAGKDWPLWENKALRFHEEDALESVLKNNAEAILFEEFLQYTFFKQWDRVKAYAHQKGIEFIGDLPFYVAYESADVWANPEIFDLNAQKHLNHVAGVPPDYFAKDGQLWGNPLYNWAAMKANHYHWWLKRMSHALKIFDVVRIDHFRAFSAFWQIDAQAKTAREGRWIKGPGMSFLDNVFETFSHPKIIAEDLGVQDPALKKLLKDSKIPGMRVLQFGFIEPSDNPHLPHNYIPNCFAYTGTHDNNTLYGWLWDLNQGERDYALNYVNYCSTDQTSWQQGGYKNQACRSLIKALWSSSANVTLIPIQDLCAFSADTRMNRPGSTKSNWSFRLSPEAIKHMDQAWLAQINGIYHRYYQHQASSKTPQ